MIFVRFIFLGIFVLFTTASFAENSTHIEERKLIFGNKLMTIKLESKSSKSSMKKMAHEYLNFAKTLEKTFYASNGKSELYKLNNMERPAYDVKVSKPMAKLLADYEGIKMRLGDCFLNCERSSMDAKTEKSNRVDIGNVSHLDLGHSIDGYVVDALVQRMSSNAKLKSFIVEFGRVSGHFSREDHMSQIELVDRLRPSFLPVSVSSIAVGNDFVATGAVGGGIHPKLPYRQVSVVANQAMLSSVLAEKLSQRPQQNLQSYKTLPGVKRLMIQKITGEWVDI